MSVFGVVPARLARGAEAPRGAAATKAAKVAREEATREDRILITLARRGKRMKRVSRRVAKHFKTVA